jgi:hypothetical protein
LLFVNVDSSTLDAVVDAVAAVVAGLTVAVLYSIDVEAVEEDAVVDVAADAIVVDGEYDVDKDEDAVVAGNAVEDSLTGHNKSLDLTMEKIFLNPAIYNTCGTMGIVNICNVHFGQGMLFVNA